MVRRHVFILSLLIGLAAAFGALAASRTVSLGNGSRASADAAIVKRTRALDRYEASLHKALTRKAPLASVAGTGAGSAVPLRIVYHRPPPIVITKHRAGGEHDFESREGGADD